MQSNLIFTILALASAPACRSDPSVTTPFTDSFDRAEIGADYYNSGAPYRIEQGALVVSGAHNHPLWLRRRLPHDVRVEFDCASRSPDGDIKVELFGDGQSYEPDEAVKADLQYTTTGYVFIFGGWRNQRSVLARLAEHQANAPMRPGPRVEPGRRYHFTLVRRGARLEWSIDGQPFLALADPEPLAGKGHDHFGFTGWETEVVFDNLRITPL